MSRNNFRISPSSILLATICFWVTVLFMRGIIFLFVRWGVAPVILIHGYHIHHFITGFLFLLIAVPPAPKKIFPSHIPLILIGSGLTAVVTKLLLGYFKYHNYITCSIWYNHLDNKNMSKLFFDIFFMNQIVIFFISQLPYVQLLPGQ